MRILENGHRNAVVWILPGETLTMAQLADSSRNPSTPVSVSIEEIWYDVGDAAAAAAINISFDATTDDLAWACTGRHHMCFESFGGISDPRSAGFTGSIIVSGATVTPIILKLRKVY